MQECPGEQSEPAGLWEAGFVVTKERGAFWSQQEAVIGLFDPVTQQLVGIVGPFN